MGQELKSKVNLITIAIKATRVAKLTIVTKGTILTQMKLSEKILNTHF